jgi:hypothetical protein
MPVNHRLKPASPFLGREVRPHLLFFHFNPDRSIPFSLMKSSLEAFKFSPSPLSIPIIDDFIIDNLNGCGYTGAHYYCQALSEATPDNRAIAAQTTFE